MTTLFDPDTRVVLPPAWESSLQSLRDGLDALSDKEMWGLTDEQVKAGTVEMFRVRARTDELSARFVSAAEDRKLPALAGATSTTTWLANLTGISRGDAKRIIDPSRHLGEFVDDTRRAWALGEVTTEQATIICTAINTLPNWVGGVERKVAQATLLDHARRFAIDDLRRLANRIIEVIDPDGAEEQVGRQLESEEKRAWGKTEISMHSAGDGMVRGRFLLPIVQGGMLSAVLEGLASPRRNAPRIYDRDGEHSDVANGTLTHAQKLGRALCELIENLPSEAMPQHGGLAASMTVNIDFEALKAGLGTALLSTGEAMSAAQARRFACTAQLIPVVLDGESTILDLGLAKRLFNRYQRIALVTRDKGCVWKGCDRPPSWTEAHHLTWHSRGGPTDLSNGALFCFHHHHLLHEGEWDARMASDGIVDVIPPRRIDPLQKPIRHNRFKAGP